MCVYMYIYMRAYIYICSHARFFGRAPRGLESFHIIIAGIAMLIIIRIFVDAIVTDTIVIIAITVVLDIIGGARFFGAHAGAFWAVSGAPRACLGPSFDGLKLHWVAHKGPLGSVLGRLGLHGGPWAVSGAHPREVLRCLEASWGAVGRCRAALGRFERSWATLVPLLGCSWPLCGFSWGALGGSLGRSWARQLPLGATKNTHLLPLVVALEPILGALRPPLAPLGQLLASILPALRCILAALELLLVLVGHSWHTQSASGSLPGPSSGL